MSTLESLIFDTVVDTEQSERKAAEELALWSNAEFTFDIKPGHGLDCSSSNDDNNNKVDQFQPQQLQPGLNDILDAATYEKLVNYLDYELPLQQQQQQQQHHLQQTLLVSAAPPPLTPTTSTPSYAPIAPRRPLLLPKPAAVDPLHLVTLVQQQQSLQQQQFQKQSPLPVKSMSRRKQGIKRTAAEAATATETATGTSTAAAAAASAETDKTGEQIAAEEDKRRRNTAASARFRIKKKMREQAMEQTVQEMKSKADHLQERVFELEQEVKWLRSLLLEKTEHQQQ